MEDRSSSSVDLPPPSFLKFLELLLSISDPNKKSVPPKMGRSFIFCTIGLCFYLFVTSLIFLFEKAFDANLDFILILTGDSSTTSVASFFCT